MTPTTLVISRAGERELSFMLLEGGAGHAPVLLRASAPFTPEHRKEIARRLEGFAACLEGRDADEPRFREIGQVLFAFLPRTIREKLRELDQPLALQTDDPAIPWEVLHDGTEFLALRLQLARQLVIHRHMAELLRPAARSADRFAALVIADPLGDLPGAADEGRAARAVRPARGLRTAPRRRGHLGQHPVPPGAPTLRSDPLLRAHGVRPGPPAQLDPVPRRRPIIGRRGAVHVPRQPGGVPERVRQ